MRQVCRSIDSFGEAKRHGLMNVNFKMLETKMQTDASQRDHHCDSKEYFAVEQKSQ